MAKSIEEPSYETIATVDDVEIRHYAPMIQAVTPLSADSDSGFSRLAGYIFRGNDNDQSIAMTAPVQQTVGAAAAEMAFMMPSRYSFDSLPTPDDDRVQLKQVAARTVAVIGFSGWATRDRVRRYTEQLTATLQEHAIEAYGSVLLNQYNPPWTVPFRRRNEVLLEVDWPQQ